MATSTKATKKTAVKKKSAAPVEVAVKTADVIEEVSETVAASSTPVLKTYDDEDTIVCRSITRGEMTYIGKKSGNYYVFANYDDTCEIEVRDLNSLRASRSQYLFDPLFIIEDEDFISQPRWEEIKQMYEKAISNDVNEVIKKPIGEFKRILPTLSKGYRDALTTEVATRIQNEEFDSLNKIKAIDEVYGTDLYCLIK